jgi:diguanylate cyclase (GGDEF)-like protein/PAS domain S-box-containing protein
MTDPSSTNQDQINEISVLKQRVQELEKSESKCKRVEEALQKSEEKFLELLEHINDIFYELDKQGVIKYCSPSVERLLGYYQEEIIGRSISDFLDTEDRFLAIENVHKVMVGQTEPHEYRIRCKTGEIRWIRVYSNPVMKGDQIVGIRGVMSDITERKQVEEALRDSEKRYRRLFESAKDGILILDADTGKVVDANPFLIQLLGYSYDELHGKHIWEIGVFKDIAASKEAFKTLQDKEYIRYEYMPLETFDGRSIDVEFVSNVYLVDHTKVIQCNIRDITERKQAEKQLKVLSSRNEAILAAIPDIIMEVDNNKIYTWANQAGIQFFGEDVIGKEAAFYFEGEQETYNTVSPLFTGFEDIIYLESWQRRKDGQKRLLAWHCHVLKDNNGQVTGALSSANDITTRKHIEEALRESENKYRELSIADGLTQLYNSRYFYHQLKMEMDRAERYGYPLTLMLLDLDDFKQFNDAYGHIEGDQVLMRLGQVVKRCLRQTDSAYRYGGEEFTILLPMTTSADGTITAERIRTEFKKEIFSPVPGQDVHVTVSIGLAQYKTQEDMKGFVHRVDQLMYQGKKNGKDRVCSES